jgi:hypothetical protein
MVLARDGDAVMAALIGYAARKRCGGKRWRNAAEAGTRGRELKKLRSAKRRSCSGAWTAAGGITAVYQEGRSPTGGENMMVSSAVLDAVYIRRHTGGQLELGDCTKFTGEEDIGAEKK